MRGTGLAIVHVDQSLTIKNRVEWPWRRAAIWLRGRAGRSTAPTSLHSRAYLPCQEAGKINYC